jgi:structural maintenance of chromosome 1
MYRKCRLEEIALPLLQGNLKHVPMEEVCLIYSVHYSSLAFLHICTIYSYMNQNLREEVAMDVDPDETGNQKVDRGQDYGIEVDFDLLDEEEREVCILSPLSFSPS